MTIIVSRVGIYQQEGYDLFFCHGQKSDRFSDQELSDKAKRR